MLLLPLCSQIPQIVGLEPACLTVFVWGKKRHLANGTLQNATKTGSETCTVWGEGVNQCWELQAFAG